MAATFAWRMIPDSPAKAFYLTRREKKIARLRLITSGHDSNESSSGSSGSDGEGNPISPNPDRDGDRKERQRRQRRQRQRQRRRWWWWWRQGRETLAALGDPVPWATAGIFSLTNMAYASLPVFLPSILHQMGHSPLASQALAAPPHLVASAAVLLVARASDASRSRAYPIAACALCSSAGYAFLALSHGLDDLFVTRGGGGGGGGGGTAAWLDVLRYLAVYPAAVGFFCVVVLTIAWNVNNARGGGGHNKGAGFALMQVVGQCGPLVGTRLYPKTDAPWFSRGMGVCAVAMLGVAGLALGLRAYLARANGRLDGEAGHGEVVDVEEEEGLVGGAGGGRYKKGFRYML